jgi:hypothetical protein
MQDRLEQLQDSIYNTTPSIQVLNLNLNKSCHHFVIANTYTQF